MANIDDEKNIEVKNLETKKTPTQGIQTQIDAINEMLFKEGLSLLTTQKENEIVGNTARKTIKKTLQDAGKKIGEILEEILNETNSSVQQILDEEKLAYLEMKIEELTNENGIDMNTLYDQITIHHLEEIFFKHQNEQLKNYDI